AGLGAAGELVGVGAGALGARDGRVTLLRRDRARALAPEPQPIPHHTALHDAIIDHLARSGASFLVAIEQAVASAVARPAEPQPPRSKGGPSPQGDSDPGFAADPNRSIRLPSHRGPP